MYKYEHLKKEKINELLSNTFGILELKITFDKKLHIFCQIYGSSFPLGFSSGFFELFPITWNTVPNRMQSRR